MIDSAAARGRGINHLRRRDRCAFTASSDALAGVTRSFPSFSSAVDEAGRSGIYARVHTSLDDVAGRALGHDVAGYVLSHGITR